MGQDIPFFLTYSLQLVLGFLLLFLLFFNTQKSYKKWIMYILVAFGLLFVYQQISAIVESETTLRIIPHTKLSLTYLLFFVATLLLITNIFQTRKKWQKINFCMWILVGIQSILYYLAFNLTGVGFNESIPFHLKSGMQGAGIGDFYSLIIAVFVAVVLFVMSAVHYFKIVIQNSTQGVLKTQWIFPVFVAILFFNPLNKDLYETYKVVEERPDFLFKNFYQKAEKNLKSEKRYNVVWIYAEAFERIYLNSEIFPDLAPNLVKLERESLSFSNIHQVWGTGWTIAGIVGSQSGVPLYAVGRQNNDLNQLPSFLPNVKGVGNILKEDGYENIFIQGSKKAFAGNDKFLESHGFRMYSFENIDEKYKTKKDLSRWGINDDQLLNFAVEKYKDLKANKKPFSLMLSTINTHSPIGFVPHAYKDYKYKEGKNKTLNAFYVSDLLISQFIEKIKKLDKEKNTIIVVSSDHLAMRNMVSEILEKNSEKRRNLFMIHFPEKISPKINDKMGSTLDQGVTLLQLMGYPVEKLGFGVSLLSDEKTLKEKAQGNTDDVLKSWKKYYFQFWEK